MAYTRLLAPVTAMAMAGMTLGTVPLAHAGPSGPRDWYPSLQAPTSIQAQLTDTTCEAVLAEGFRRDVQPFSFDVVSPAGGIYTSDVSAYRTLPASVRLPKGTTIDSVTVTAETITEPYAGAIHGFHASPAIGGLDIGRRIAILISAMDGAHPEALATHDLMAHYFDAELADALWDPQLWTLFNNLPPVTLNEQSIESVQSMYTAAGLTPPETVTADMLHPLFVMYLAWENTRTKPNYFPAIRPAEDVFRFTKDNAQLKPLPTTIVPWTWYGASWDEVYQIKDTRTGFAYGTTAQVYTDRGMNVLNDVYVTSIHGNAGGESGTLVIPKEYVSVSLEDTPYGQASVITADFSQARRTTQARTFEGQAAYQRAWEEAARITKQFTDEPMWDAVLVALNGHGPMTIYGDAHTPLMDISTTSSMTHPNRSVPVVEGTREQRVRDAAEVLAHYGPNALGLESTVVTEVQQGLRAATGSSALLDTSNPDYDLLVLPSTEQASKIHVTGTLPFAEQPADAVFEVTTSMLQAGHTSRWEDGKTVLQVADTLQVPTLEETLAAWDDGSSELKYSYNSRTINGVTVDEASLQNFRPGAKNIPAAVDSTGLLSYDEGAVNYALTGENALWQAFGPLEDTSKRMVEETSFVNMNFSDYYDVDTVPIMSKAQAEQHFDELVKPCVSTPEPPAPHEPTPETPTTEPPAPQEPTPDMPTTEPSSTVPQPNVEAEQPPASEFRSVLARTGAGVAGLGLVALIGAGAAAALRRR